MERSDLSNTDHSLDWAAANIYIGIDIDILIDILIEIDTNNQTKTYIHTYIHLRIYVYFPYTTRRTKNPSKTHVRHHQSINHR